MKCIHCGASCNELYHQYSPSVLKLTTCAQCNQIADDYLEYDWLYILLDLLVQKFEAYMHVMHNASVSSIWRLAVIFGLCRAFTRWTNFRYSATYAPAHPFASLTLVNNSESNYPPIESPTTAFLTNLFNSFNSFSQLPGPVNDTGDGAHLSLHDLEWHFYVSAGVSLAEMATFLIVTGAFVRCFILIGARSTADREEKFRFSSEAERLQRCARRRRLYAEQEGIAAAEQSTAEDGTWSGKESNTYTRNKKRNKEIETMNDKESEYMHGSVDEFKNDTEFNDEDSSGSKQLILNAKDAAFAKITSNLALSFYGEVLGVLLIVWEGPLPFPHIALTELFRLSSHLQTVRCLIGRQAWLNTFSTVAIGYFMQSAIGLLLHNILN